VQPQRKDNGLQPIFERSKSSSWSHRSSVLHADFADLQLL
jgi:hypothetical protein